ncbi:glucosamine-6-phosphate deaminase [Halobacillus sp. BBL2006]|uniref:glucosamine-6-phosphate deaminase n=1 Tax=Halobacillus sp. BBL2006 TaxID=1543706 RepID=UPI0005430E3E|nr:glucosamine-6-phosphate deaminase [Halobacillus sp. BBL2006]KHE73024.1 glucosamine-6-phosphate deaminase [Halobacillus sp. BBL2006]
MKIIKVADYDEMSRKSAEMFYHLIHKQPEIRLGLATGSTPIGFYDQLVGFLKSEEVDVSKLLTFNLDEYIGLKQNSPQSFYAFMKEHFYQPVGLRDDQTFIPDGTVQDPKKESEHYEQLIQQAGGIDIQLLGVGTNGHIGFNEPGTPFNQRTHEVKLKESTREANARFFDSKDVVPTRAITMGIETILDAKKVVLLASGERKAEAIYQLVQGEVSGSWPITALKNHPDVTLFVDKDAASKLFVNES